MSDIDVKQIKADINVIKEFAASKNKITDGRKKELLFKDFRPDIYDKYATIVKTICRGDDLTVLNKMIASLEKVDKGKSTLKKESKKLGNELADQYVHPKVKKEKKDK